MHWGITQVTENADHDQDPLAQQHIIHNYPLGSNFTGDDPKNQQCEPSNYLRI